MILTEKWCSRGQHWKIRELDFGLDKRTGTEVEMCYECKAAYERRRYHANLEANRAKLAIRMRRWSARERERQQTEP